jgi:hypothetical protein
MDLDHTYLVWSIYSNLSRTRQQIWIDPLAPRRRAPNIIHSTMADRSAGSYSVSLSKQPIKQWEKSNFCCQPATMLTGLIYQHVICTFNTCSRGPTHWSLTDTSGGYNLGGAGFLHTTPWPFQPVESTFHLRVSPGLQFNHNLSKILKFKFRESMAATWSFDHSTIYRDLQLRLATTNDLSLAIKSTRVEWKVSLMQLRYPFNSYNLMHKQES